ncbi:prephenate dehydrogenase [Aphanothece hegewaldii CCALA 016]|uniref:Prephenate dehydrogenase n=1 Tax=Aphanothece hegewaldii CCALA 016 TaxID=2107694 RepID=A0A2T1M1E1_9CHRO|nr:prephenate dehydrogenase/arogenate dehydrogenase family protein [Aphanothece hegewaldii]PSF38510.1 prephenate dehydrogenase [Aphanothece hegewaldii CCALA 016]
MLPTINRELIRLLEEQITLLFQAENGVCDLSKPKRRITIIGGCGKMGLFFGQQLSHNQCFVNNLGRDWSNAPQLLGQADLVLIAVPIEQTLAVVEKASQFLDPSTVLVDLTSIKTPIVSAMLSHHPGPVLGLHPMFGPGVQSFLGQNVIVCPGRNLEACQWFLDFIEEKGGKLSFCTPEEHDRMMASVQAVRHFVAFSLGVFIAEEGIDLDRTLNFASPLYRMQLDMVSRLFAQDSSLSFKLMLGTPQHQNAIARLDATIRRVAQMLKQNDQAALQKTFETTRSIFGQDAHRALSESNYLIDRLSSFLAAQEVTPKNPINQEFIA